MKVVMDTPEKTQIAASLSKFEDSPVFNYINSLSPIKPVKSIHITQAFNPLSFSSLPSVFTSPHVSSHKESRFLRRHNLLDASQCEIASDIGGKSGANEGDGTDASPLYDDSADSPANFDPDVHIEEPSMDMPSDHSKFAIELPRTLKYDCGSPDCDPTACDKETKSASELVDKSLSVVQQGTESGSSKGEPHVTGAGQTEIKFGGCDWDNLMSDAADLLFFNSPNDSEAFKGLFQKSLTPGARFSVYQLSPLQQHTMIEVPRMHTTGPLDSGEQNETGDQSPQSAETSKLLEVNDTQGNLAISSQIQSGEANEEDGTFMPFACQSDSNLHRGFRRRCLDFEMVGGRRRNINRGSNSGSIMPSHYNEKAASKDKEGVCIKPGGDSARVIVPGIGLHLNALAITSRDNTVNGDGIASGELQPNLPSSAAAFHTQVMAEQLHESSTTVTTELGIEPADNEAELAEDLSQPSDYLVADEFNQNSPKKKRRKGEQAGESESCKRCNCKKSKCLKLYCECFAAGVYCIEPCACQDCFNKPIHEDTVLATRKQIESRNPLAFAPKVIRSFDPAPEIGEDSSKTPASARHKRGCNCKKSSCLKKYCECYQGGVGCSINCRCEGCKNAFGRKDGSIPTETEVEAEEDETEMSDKVGGDQIVHKTEIPNNEDQSLGSSFPITPLQHNRPLMQLPFSSRSRPQSLLAAGSSSMLYNAQKYGKPSIIRSQSKFEKHLQTVPEDEMPEILRASCSPSTGIKSASPNSKRISPPHYDLGTSPNRRSSRKLILQSIPSFPSLTQH